MSLVGKIARLGTLNRKDGARPGYLPPIPHPVWRLALFPNLLALVVANTAKNSRPKFVARHNPPVIASIP